ncbi:MULTISPECIES: PRC-barrel domain-containing protein [unclassified Streptomyces]|uniref:PRC-barrel domain-containing protein n=1 Tax=unclassified Streptomyces TaxID=2593676 RepID=UPI00074A2E78|nr:MULTISPECIES: PRC-barrel domain-containing protein [unclassified Streptomyces]KUL71086.1 photosystem reaction center subunit H [Streptomyces sp. NRRL WC-3604]KUL76996.1 photosystem reaction center subunit H [Streptomyces sp. NRRL WC-3605]
MFEAGDIREWRGHDVVDAEARKIGKLESVYVDTVTDAPHFATVTVGMPTRHRLVFVPLVGATVGPGYLKVAYPKNLVRDAPSIDMDGVLPAEDEKAVFAHYELAYQPGAAGERRLARR